MRSSPTSRCRGPFADVTVKCVQSADALWLLLSTRGEGYGPWCKSFEGGSRGVVPGGPLGFSLGVMRFGCTCTTCAVWFNIVVLGFQRGR